MDLISLVTCKICGNTLDDPMLLPCSHNVCRKCAMNSSRDGVSFACSCGSSFQLSQMVPNPAISVLIQSNQGALPAHSEIPQKPSRRLCAGGISFPDSPVMVNVKIVDGILMCTKHDKEIDLYDYSTRTLICSHCALYAENGVVGSPDKSAKRRCLPLAEAAEDLLPEMAERSAEQRKQIETISGFVEQLEAMDARLISTHKQCVTQLHEEFEMLHKLLQRREAEVLEELEQRYTEQHELYRRQVSDFSDLQRRSRADLREREECYASRDPLRVLPLMDMKNELIEETRERISTHKCNQHSTQQLIFAPHLRQILASHGTVYARRGPEQAPGTGNFSQLDLPHMATVFSNLSDAISGLTDVSALMIERSRIEDDHVRVLRSITGATPRPDVLQRAATSTWKAITRDQKELASVARTGAELRDVHEIIRQKQAELEKKRQRLQEKMRAWVKAMSELTRSVKSQLATAQNCRKELITAHTALAQGGNGRLGRNSKRFKQAQASYLKERQQYKELAIKYRQMKREQPGFIRETYEALEQIESDRVDLLQRAVELYGAALVTKSLGTHNGLSDALSRSTLMDANESLAVVAKDALARAPQPPSDIIDCMEMLRTERIPYDPTQQMPAPGNSDAEWGSDPAGEDEAPKTAVIPMAIPESLQRKMAMIQGKDEVAPPKQTKSRPALPPPPKPPLNEVAYLIYPYEGREAPASYKCLSIDAQSVCVDDNGVMLTLPRNYVILQSEARTAVAQYDFEADNANEVSVRAGDELLVLSEMEEWLTVRSPSGAMGFVPLAYVTLN